jgi:uncharacterized protein YdcH (DUF465 family)
VVKAETATSDAPSDDTLKKLKEKRLQVKDKSSAITDAILMAH